MDVDDWQDDRRQKSEVADTAVANVCDHTTCQHTGVRNDRSKQTLQEHRTVGAIAGAVRRVKEAAGAAGEGHRGVPVGQDASCLANQRERGRDADEIPLVQTGFSALTGVFHIGSMLVNTLSLHLFNI